MTKKSLSILETDIDGAVLTGGRRTTAANVRPLLKNISDSSLNAVDGGLVVESLTGYSTLLTPIDDKHFATKKYVDDNSSSPLLLLPLDGSRSMTDNITLADTKGVRWSDGSSITQDGFGTIQLTSINASINLYAPNEYVNVNTLGVSASTVPYLDSSKNLISSTVTPTELGYLSGVTSAIQTQLNAKQITLVSGTNIKTINGTSILGSGDLVITSGVSSVSGTTNRITSTGGSTPIIDISATFEALLGKVVNPLSQFASTTSAQLLGVISDETGSGFLVFSASPTFTGTPVLSTATATSLAFTSTSNAGLKLNNLTQTQRDLLSGSQGFLIENTTTKRPDYYNGSLWRNISSEPEEVGLAFTEPWTNLTSWTSVGTPSASVSGGRLSLGGSSSFSNHYIRCSGYGNSNVEFAVFQYNIVAGTIGASTSGKAFGLQSQALSNAASVMVNLELSTTGTGTIKWYANNSSTVIQTSLQNLSISAGDTINCQVWIYPEKMVFRAALSTGTYISDVLYFKYATTSLAAVALPNAYQFAFFNLGGTHTVGAFTSTIKQLKGAKLILGDSITQRSGALDRYINNLKTKYDCIVEVNGMPGIRMADHNMAELALMQPEEIILATGSNDVFATNAATATTAENTLITALGVIGYSVANGNLKAATLLPRGSSEYVTFNTSRTTTFGIANTINFFGVASDGTVNLPVILSTDAIHPNDLLSENMSEETARFYGFKKRSYVKPFLPVVREFVTGYTSLGIYGHSSLYALSVADDQKKTIARFGSSLTDNGAYFIKDGTPTYLSFGANLLGTTWTAIEDGPNIIGRSAAGTMSFYVTSSATTAGSTITLSTQERMQLGVSSVGLRLQAGNSTGITTRVGGSINTGIATTGNTTTTETDLFSYSSLANTLNVDKSGFTFEVTGTFAANATTKQLKVKYGATVLDFGAIAANSGTWVIRGSVIRTGAATQKIYATLTSDNTLITGTSKYSTAAETLTNAITLKVTGQAGVGGANNDIVCEVGFVNWRPAEP